MEKFTWKLIEHDGVMRETMGQIDEGRREQVESYYEPYDEFGEMVLRLSRPDLILA